MHFSCISVSLALFLKYCYHTHTKKTRLIRSPVLPTMQCGVINKINVHSRTHHHAFFSLLKQMLVVIKMIIITMQARSSDEMKLMKHSSQVKRLNYSQVA